MNPSAKKALIVAIFILAALLVLWRFVVVSQESTETQTTVEAITTTTTPNNTTPTSPETGSVDTKSTAVKTSYKNPGGSDEVGFELIVDNEGTITEANVDVLAKNPISIKRQEAFAAALPGAVVGKKLSELSNIDRVGGSSLTTASFNESLGQLKAGI